MNDRIGVIGTGFVGDAVATGFSLYTGNVRTWDKYKPSLCTFPELVYNSDFIFICVPTPTSENGSQDTTAIYDVLDNIATITSDSKLIVLKSTVLPGTSRRLANQYPAQRIVFNPEFLSARTARFDFINPARIILGGKDEDTKLIGDLYRKRFNWVPIKCVTWEEAEFVKYMANCFFAVKIAFANEMREVSERYGIDYNKVKSLVVADGKIADSHLDVPGHDGKLGFGGSCFPKDMKAFLKFVREDGNGGVDIIEAALNSNRRIRNE